ncbi:MAG: hypothetical protein KJO69_05865 [Gammaproteobacteria bacterium]|nr:hypothetical protein [Gammaproteobacteria bacterium]
MFATELDPKIFETQREFIRLMEGNRDFVWWATVLVKEETKELQEAMDADQMDMEHIFKELGDLVYVVAGFYNTMPLYPNEVISEDLNNEIQGIIEQSHSIASQVCNSLQLQQHHVEAAFYAVHTSNLTKINPETGEPDRREDGKILKGKHYKPADMKPVVDLWMKELKANANSQ